MKIPNWFKKALVGNGIDRETLARRVFFPQRLALGHQGGLPGLLIVGAQKSGTTALHNLLVQHPKIRRGIFKESHFFERPSNFDKGIIWYRSIYPKLAEGELAIDSTPMMHHSYVPALVHQTLPDARIVMLLRDPVKRSFSHYLHNVARRREMLSFEEAIETEDQRIALRPEDIGTESLAMRNYSAYSYKLRSRYDYQVEMWREAFGDERVKVLIFEEFIQNPSAAVDEITDWLGLERVALSSPRRAQNTALVEQQMSKATEERLRREFAPSVNRLRTLLGRDLPWDYPKDPK